MGATKPRNVQNVINRGTLCATVEQVDTNHYNLPKVVGPKVSAMEKFCKYCNSVKKQVTCIMNAGHPMAS